MSALASESVVLGGLSMGGYAAFALHRVAPARIAGLILADTKSAADTPQARAGREGCWTSWSRGAPAASPTR